MNFEFQGTLYNSKHDLAAAIAETWLHADGWNRKSDILDAIATASDAELADECCAGWELDDEWLDERGINHQWIVNAFADIRSNPDAAFLDYHCWNVE